LRKTAQILFRLDTTGQAGAEEALAAMQCAGVRILAACLPHVVIGESSREAAQALVGRHGVLAAYAEAVPPEVIGQAEEDFRTVAVAWNQRSPRPRHSETEGLAWDTPTRLAPDPPPRIQAMLRAWEEQSRSGAD